MGTNSTDHDADNEVKPNNEVRCVTPHLEKPSLPYRPSTSKDIHLIRSRDPVYKQNQAPGIPKYLTWWLFNDAVLSSYNLACSSAAADSCDAPNKTPIRRSSVDACWCPAWQPWWDGYPSITFEAIFGRSTSRGVVSLFITERGGTSPKREPGKGDLGMNRERRYPWKKRLREAKPRRKDSGSEHLKPLRRSRASKDHAQATTKV